MLAVFLISLFATLLIGTPIAFSLLTSGSLMMLAKDVFDVRVVAQQMLGGFNGFTLLAMPFFVLAGEAMNKGGISEAIVKAVMAVFGRIRGALGYVVIFSCMIFAGLSGSAIADAACLGGILIPLMLKNNYSRGRATGLLVSSAIMANIIPPSIGFILFCLASGASVTKMFMGGIVPGVIFALTLSIAWFFVARKDNMQARQDKLPPKEIAGEIFRALPALILPLFIIIGLRGGFFTPTEAGAVAAAYAIICGMLIYKRIKFKDLFEMFGVTVETTARVTVIVAASLLVSWIMTVSQLSATLVNSFSFLVEHPVLLMLACQVLFLLMGMVMETSSIIMIMVPIILPLVKAAGISVEYFGVVMIINLTFGMLTPPVGTVLYVGMGISKASMAETIKGAAPFMLLEILLIILFSVFPEIITVPMAFITR